MELIDITSVHVFTLPPAEMTIIFVLTAIPKTMTSTY